MCWHSPCSQDDDLCSGWSHPHFHTRVTILSKLPGQELIKFGLEDAIRDKLTKVETLINITTHK